MEIKKLNKEAIIKISKLKGEDEEILKYRLDSFKEFEELELPSFGPQINLNFDDIIYYKNDDNKIKNNWDDIDKDIYNELNGIGVVDGEKNLAGMGVQYESEVIYHNMLKELAKKNIIFTSIEDGMKKYPELTKKYFAKLVNNKENKFTALNGAVFSGGSFIYIPPFTKLDRPLQSYFRINAKNMGQFERTLIIVDHDSSLHYIEGCSAKTYNEQGLHAAVVEIFVEANSTCRYSTIQNWSDNVLNLVTKRAVVLENGLMEWIDGNVGSKITMKYPACILKGDNSKGTCITISVASKNQFQDTGAKMIHIGRNTSSNIISKSIAKNKGMANYRGKVEIKDTAINSVSSIKCDTLLLDDKSKSYTYPSNICNNNTSNIFHEATISKISEENLFYLMSRGISLEKAKELIILGFIDTFKKELPLEYAVELNQLLKEIV
ncbi:MAG: Fe-S cluster assembly protein SufB [Bacilli bacterium]